MESKDSHRQLHEERSIMFKQVGELLDEVRELREEGNARKLLAEERRQKK